MRGLTFVRMSAVAFAVAASFTPLKADAPGTDPFLGEWAIRAEPEDAAVEQGQTAFSEAVLFHNGEFSAAVFANYGFAPVTYTINYENGPPVFSAVLTSSDRGTLTFSGSVDQAGLEGTLVWARDDDHVYRYLLHGERSGDQ